MNASSACRLLMLAAATVLPGVASGAACAQTAKQMVGTWQLVSSVNTSPSGAKIEPFGHTPVGLAAFTADGHFLQVLLRGDLPKVASNNRGQETPDEAQAIAKGSIGLFGTYSVQGKVLTLKFDGSTFPNWIGTQQVRDLSGFNGNEMTWNVPASSLGGQNELVWKRVK